jgi:hypothetical protein
MLPNDPVLTINNNNNNNNNINNNDQWDMKIFTHDNGLIEGGQGMS